MTYILKPYISDVGDDWISADSSMTISLGDIGLLASNDSTGLALVVMFSTFSSSARDIRPMPCFAGVAALSNLSLDVTESAPVAAIVGPGVIDGPSASTGSVADGLDVVVVTAVVVVVMVEVEVEVGAAVGSVVVTDVVGPVVVIGPAVDVELVVDVGTIAGDGIIAGAETVAGVGHVVGARPVVGSGPFGGVRLDTDAGSVVVGLVVVVVVAAAVAVAIVVVVVIAAAGVAANSLVVSSRRRCCS